ncbi:hypothetical protein [Paraglaciecola sp. L3A3]|uniref:hypothetical protein n=1 Tax=Paraglaciecola sp. L3A3 TaxID=2686358 RepID=UPI00131B3A51|nr:hypothetical protein [Paraglaciecola sp. L3A3]
MRLTFYLPQLKWTKISSLWPLILVLWVTSALAKTIDTNKPEEYLAKQSWGQVLFEFYQQNYRQGLVQLAVAEQQSLGEYKQQAQVAKGGMSLVYGLNNQAEQILTQLTEQAEPEVQAQAWFWLSKAYFDSGQYIKTQQGLDNSQAWRKQYDIQQQEQLAYIQGQLLVAIPNQSASQQRFSNVVNSLPNDSVYRPYLHYNYGLFELEKGEYPLAIASFRQALNDLSAQEKAPWQQSWWANWTNGLWFKPTDKMTESEYQGLSDRIHLALGYTYLNTLETEQALTHFSNVHSQRQDGANALLGYAQALANQGKLPMALAIWQKISIDFPARDAALQGLLAMAWQLEQAGDEVQAWQKLLVSEKQLAVAQQDINTSLALIQQADFLPRILVLTENTQANLDGITWPLSQSDIMQSFLAGQSKQQLKTWLDLQQESNLLTAKKQDLAEFKSLLDERKQAAVARGKQVAQKDFVLKTTELDKQLQRLSRQVELAQATQDASGLANESQLAQLARIQQAKLRITKIKGRQKLSPSYAKRLARVDGILTWYFADNFQPLLWQHQQGITETEQLLDIAKQSQTNLLKQIAAPAEYTEQYQKIAHLAGRVNHHLQTIKGLQKNISQQIKSKAISKLSTRQIYLDQVEQSIQLAKLRLQDQDPQQLSPNEKNIGETQ